jgi:MATE family multidrug resistance protein
MYDDYDPKEREHSLLPHVESQKDLAYYTPMQVFQHATRKPKLFKTIKEILLDTIPSTMGLLFIFICETINIVYIGSTENSNDIAAIGLGTIYINATGYILGVGLLGGLDTLCSQSYGAREFYLLGIYSNVARIIVTVFFLIICIPCIFYCESLLLLIGQVDEVSHGAGTFVKSMIPALFFGLHYNTNLRYIQSMNIFLPGMIVTLFTAVFHSLWCYLFIIFFQFGLTGAGYAMGITQLLNWFLISVYIHYYNPCPDSYFYPNEDTWNIERFKDYLKYAIPAAILFAADWLGFDFLTIMASYMGPVDLAANVCLFNFITLIFMIPMGLSFAATTLVGNSIGSGNIIKAKNYAKISVIIGSFIVGAVTIFIVFFKDMIPYIYTNDLIIAKLVTSLLDIYIWFGIIDAIQIILHGIIKGLGKQKIASIVALVVLYPIMLPLAYILAFELNLGIYGLWYSQLISVFILAGSYFIIIFLLDWQDISDKSVSDFADLRKSIDSKGYKSQ